MEAATTDIEIIAGAYYITGNMVWLSVRMNIKNNISSANIVSLFKLPANPLIRATENCVSYTTIYNGTTWSSYAGMAALVYNGGSYYVRERVTSTLTSGSILDMMLIYAIPQ